MIFVCLFLTLSVSAETVTQELKDKINKLTSSDGAKKMSMVDEVLKKSSSQDISRINEIINSQEYQSRLKNHASKAKQVLGLEVTTNLPPVSAEETNVIGDRLVLFVSSSMPIHVLRNYVNDIDKVGGVMIFKGTIGGIDSIKPTMAFLRKLMVVDDNCTAIDCKIRQTNISIDPERFSHHGIKRVPALIFEKNMKIQAYCKEGDKGPKAEIIAYGDASLAGLSNVLFQYTKSPSIKSLLNTLRGIK
jgi:conjugal transfer pilus assembly protein TrbC